MQTNRKCSFSFASSQEERAGAIGSLENHGARSGPLKRTGRTGRAHRQRCQRPCYARLATCVISLLPAGPSGDDRPLDLRPQQECVLGAEGQSSSVTRACGHVVVGVEASPSAAAHTSTPPYQVRQTRGWGDGAEAVKMVAGASTPARCLCRLRGRSVPP